MSLKTLKKIFLKEKYSLQIIRLEISLKLHEKILYIITIEQIFEWLVLDVSFYMHTYITCIILIHIFDSKLFIIQKNVSDKFYFVSRKKS